MKKHLLRRFAGFLAARPFLLWTLAILYLIFPVDLIPDFIPVFGYADDLIVMLIPLLLRKWRPPSSPSHRPKDVIDTTLVDPK